MIDSWSRIDLERGSTRMRRICSEVAHHFSFHQEQKGEKVWNLDVLPRILSSNDWFTIRKGVIQRLQAFHALLRDLYGPRRIILDKIIPVEVVLADPGYYRELIGASQKHSGLGLGAVDLVQAEDGSWKVYENLLSFTPGISHVIQNRRMLAQAVPGFFRDHDVAPVAGFCPDLVESLRGGNSSSSQRIILLNRGDQLRPHFDDSFLARHMGVVSARPADLIVREGRVHLRTIEGLERVHVILRKVETIATDPVTFPHNEGEGVPGLVHCVREGKVRIENQLGAEVADNRALLQYSDAIIRYYLNEEPILPTVRTYHCFDRDQKDWVLSRLDQYQLDYTVPPRVLQPYWPTEKFPSISSQYLSEILKISPEWVIAREKTKARRQPVWADGGLTEKPYFLRVFGLWGKHPSVMPGGLSWTSPDGCRGDVISAMKDTWVIDEELGRDAFPESEALEISLTPGVQSVPSRVAESLYWMGRYLERARNAAHQAALLESIRWTELSPADFNYYWPLWRGVAAAASFDEILKKSSFPENFDQIFADFVSSMEENQFSVALSLQYARNNLNRIQEWVSPELVEVSYSLFSSFEQILLEESETGDQWLRACRMVSWEHARWVGVLERTLSHDAGYQFWRIGSTIERMIGLTHLLEAILPGGIQRQRRHVEDDTDLTALLRLLGCLDAYRREYRSRAYLDRIVRMLWVSRNLPISFCFNFLVLESSLLELDHQTRKKTTSSLRSRVKDLLKRLNLFKVEEVFPARALHLDFGNELETINIRTVQRLNHELVQIREELEALHGALDDRYFQHQ